MALNYQLEESTNIKPTTVCHGNSPVSNVAARAGVHFKCPPAALPRSKPAILILLWNAIVALTLTSVIGAGLATCFDTYKDIHPVYYMIGIYGGISLLQLLCYPLGGLLADIHFGRYRTVLCSMISLWLGYLCLSVLSIAFVSSGNGILLIVLAGIISLLTINGFTGFQANAVQFGLDQLLDVPSSELSIFLHWFVWMDFVGTLTSRMFGTAFFCNHKILKDIVSKFASHVIFVMVTALFFVTCYKRHWFHREPCTHNPYGTVYRVLKFAARHDRPLRPSAFTYSDDERPTRIEFAKQRFGGPFTTETVEDVKTFLRILVMLVAIGPIFTLRMASLYIFPLFGIHIGPNVAIGAIKNCHDLKWLFLQSENLSYVVIIIVIPVTMTVVYPRIPRWFPTILQRIGIGVVLLVLAVASILFIEVTGHIKFNTHANNASNVSCMFLAEYHKKGFSQTLELNLWYLIVPNILSGIAEALIYISILEFISAQSPHTMKGLILGAFYAIRGFFIALGCVFTIPFAQERLWGNCNKPLNCGFYFYLMNTLWGVASIVLFWAAAKWYQYRVREDRPYEHHYAEEYYSRYIQATETSDELEKEHEALTSHAQIRYGST